MAAKLEEPIQPSYKRMVRLIEKEWNLTISNLELEEMERSVINELDF